MIEKLNNPIRIFSWSIIFLTFAFLINNILNHWYDYPGVDKLFGSYDKIYNAYKEVLSVYSEDENKKLFQLNSNRIYKIN